MLKITKLNAGYEDLRVWVDRYRYLLYFLTMLKLEFTNQIFKEGKTYVAYSPELDVSSCGQTVDEARKNLKEALLGFLESAHDRGTLEEILAEAGYLPNKLKTHWRSPEFLMLEKSQVTLEYA